MDPIAGMTPSGRRIAGPAADLVELESNKGLKHTALVFDEDFRDHPALNDDLRPFLGFMKKPGVTGVVALTDYSPEDTAFVYATGTVWSVAEVVRAYADLGETCGVRAGLELAYVASEILQEAAEEAKKHELWNHGSLSPWNIMIRPDGQVMIIGYGVPQPEIYDFIDDETLLPKEDSFRYCPPERLEDQGEDLTSDLFALALISLELMTGRPVYDGLINDIRQQAARAEGTYRLYKWKELIPDHVREVLGRALKYDHDARYRTATEFTYAVHDLLGSPDTEGSSLLEVMRRVKMSEQKGKPLVGGRTAALTKDELAALAADLDDDADDRPLPPPKRPRPGDDVELEPAEEEDEEKSRWGKVTRAGRRTRKPTGKEPPSRSLGRSSGGASSRDDLRARLKSGRGSASGRGGDTDSQGAARSREDLKRSLGRSKDDLRESLKRRLRSSIGREEGERKTAEPQPPEPPPPREEEEAPAPQPVEPPAAAAEAAAPVAAEQENDEVPPTDDDEDEADALSTSGGAAALLARLKNSSGGRKKPPALRPARKPTAESVPEPEPAPEAVEAAPEVVDEPRVTTPKATAPIAGPPAPQVDDAAVEAASRAVRPQLVRGSVGSGARRANTTAPVDRSSVDKEYFHISAHGAAPVRTRLKIGDPLAESAWRLAMALEALSTDLTGQLTGWYRLEQGGLFWPGNQGGGVLDPNRPVELAFVPNRMVRATIEVQGVEPPIRFQTVLGTAVPANALVAHLRGWLELPGERWRLYVGGEGLDPLQILEDYEPTDGLVVVVKR